MNDVEPTPAPCGGLIVAGESTVASATGHRLWPRRLDDPDTARRVRASAAGVAAGVVPFLVVLWNGRLDPLRTARAEGFGSNFYDLQARALFHGHLDLPYRILGIESFNVDGRTYMYFPPFPAILRMPVLMITSRFDGRLTAPSMLLAWVVLAAASVTLVWRVRQIVMPETHISRADAVASGAFIAAVTGGTVLLYIGSLPWIYHEVYFWSAAWAVAALSCFARLALPNPRHGHVLLLACCIVGLILTRATAGWPVALATVAVGMWTAVRDAGRKRLLGLLVVAAGLVPLAASALINWIKFRHPYMLPLEYQQWTEESARRRLALRMNGGSLAGTQFLPTTIVNYFRPDGMRFVPYFPFVTLPAEPARSYAGAFLDQRYRTGSVTAFMPLLFLLAVGGFVTTFRRRAGRALASMRLPLLGALGITAMVMCYGYIGFRYTSEFVAVMAGAGSVGVAELTRRMRGWGRRARRGVLVAAATLTGFSVVANMAVAVATARSTARGGGLEQLLSWQERISSITGNPIAARTHLVDELPASAAPDELFIVGECDALFLSTGELYEPWITVQRRDLRIIVEASSDGIRAGSLSLLMLDGVRTRGVTIETSPPGRARIRIGEGMITFPTDWQELPSGGRLELNVHGDTARDAIDVTFGTWSGHVPLAEWDPSWNMIVTHMTPTLAPVETQLRAGVGLTYEPGPIPDLCNRLRDRASD